MSLNESSDQGTMKSQGVTTRSMMSKIERELGEIPLDLGSYQEDIKSEEEATTPREIEDGVRKQEQKLKSPLNESGGVLGNSTLLANEKIKMREEQTKVIVEKFSKALLGQNVKEFLLLFRKRKLESSFLKSYGGGGVQPLSGRVPQWPLDIEQPLVGILNEICTMSGSRLTFACGDCQCWEAFQRAVVAVFSTRSLGHIRTEALSAKHIAEYVRGQIGVDGLNAKEVVELLLEYWENTPFTTTSFDSFVQNVGVKVLGELTGGFVTYEYLTAYREGNEYKPGVAETSQEVVQQLVRVLSKVDSKLVWKDEAHSNSNIHGVMSKVRDPHEVQHVQAIRAETGNAGSARGGSGQRRPSYFRNRARRDAPDKEDDDRCYRCGQPGHIAIGCRNVPAKRAVLDSGASTHAVTKN